MSSSMHGFSDATALNNRISTSSFQSSWQLISGIVAPDRILHSGTSVLVSARNWLPSRLLLFLPHNCWAAAPLRLIIDSVLFIIYQNNLLCFGAAILGESAALSKREGQGCRKQRTKKRIRLNHGDLTGMWTSAYHEFLKKQSKYEKIKEGSKVKDDDVRFLIFLFFIAE